MKKTAMQKYARLIARKGVNVRKGQEVVIRAGLDQPEFVRMVADECYKAGASLVRMDWRDQGMTKVHYRRATVKNLARVEDFEKAKMEYYTKALPAMIYIDSEDPDGLAGVNQAKMAKVSQLTYPIMKPYNDAMENKYQWCIAAVPGPAWAKKVFPGMRVSTAMEKLWELILYTSRADGDDPVAAWEAHNADLAARCAYLNGLNLRELRYHSANGTDLTVGLIPEGIFCGGSECVANGGVEFNPNIPSEEVFTSPMRGKAEGTVVATKPLSFRGQLIENFSVTFKDGKAVDVKAEKNEELLRTMIALDENAPYLGECALIPQDSPIQKSGVTFFNTLFDENASCHLALGMGFTNCIKDYDQKTLEECRALGINDSIIHTDFMIGAPDMAIDGVDADGKVYPLFREGNWAF